MMPVIEPSLVSPSENVTHTAGDHAVRPKISKRPAQFSGSTRAPGTALAPLLTPEAPLPPATRPPTAGAWQDDGRFAVALLAIVILMNLIVSYWLSHVKPVMHEQNPIAAEMNITGPAENDAAGTTVTTPEEDEPIHMLGEPAPVAIEQ